jgi:hypothetical protein
MTELKAFAHKPEPIFAERFDGTPETAKKILDWFRSHPESGYSYHELKLQETRYDLGQANPVRLDRVPCLELHSKTSHYYLHIGTWLVLKETNQFTTCSDQHIADHYTEL